MTKIFNKKTQTNLRKKLRNEPTKSELIVWKHLKGRQLGFKFRRQCGIGKYVADFYCPEVKLVVEIDGLSHAEKTVFQRDQVKEEYFKALGLSVRRYSSEQVFGDIEQVKEGLYHFCLKLKGELTSP